MSRSSFSRRQFLTTSTGASLAFLSGCSLQNEPVLNVRPLVGAVPAQILGRFQSQLRQSTQPATLQFLPETNPSQLFKLLQEWRQANVKADSSPASFLDRLPLLGKSGRSRVADLVSLSDYWLQKAIQQSLIQPFEVSALPGWENLDPRWRSVVTRDPQGFPVATGPVWGIPYRWGTMVIAYRKDLFKQRGLQPPTDWSDLWQPGLKHRFSLPDQAREVIGLTLKKLGKSYNTTDLSGVPQLEAELQALHQQVKLYSSTAYLQPLMLGNTWAAVGWSSDILPILQRNQQLAAVIPQSGASLWADMWVRPSAVEQELSKLAIAWLQFGWQPAIASFWSNVSQTALPVLTNLPAKDLPESLQNNRLLLPESKLFDKNEFLLPLPEAAIAQYRELWLTLRKDS